MADAVVVACRRGFVIGRRIRAISNTLDANLSPRSERNLKNDRRPSTIRNNETQSSATYIVSSEMLNAN